MQMLKRGRSLQMVLRPGVLGLAMVLCLLAAPAYADTIRVYGATGTGYTDITTDSQGREIRRTEYNEDGTARKHIERDLETGTTRTTEYEKGKPKTRTTTDREGHTRERISYDGKGRVYERETRDEDLNTERERYQYDDEGRVKQVDKIGDGGGIDETIELDYDESGRLKKTTRYRDNPDGQLVPDGWIEFDGDGNVTGRWGNTDGLQEEAAENAGQGLGDADTHVTHDPSNGNTVHVRHNPDGSYDVTVIDREGRVISRQYLSRGRCYLGDECPFHINKR